MKQRTPQTPRQIVDKLPENAVPIPGVREAWASPAGGIFSAASGRLLKLRFRRNSSGYMQVGLIDSAGVRKSFLVHRILANLFVAGDLSLTVDHIDGDRQNNKLENLRWITRRENSRLGMERHPEKMRIAWSSGALRVRGTSVHTGTAVEYASVVLAATAMRAAKSRYQYRSSPCGSNISKSIREGKAAYGHRWEYL